MTLVIRKDITEAETKILLEYLFEITSYFAFVLRTDLDTTPEVNYLLNELRPFLVSSTPVKEWPGTILIDQFATLYKYDLNLESKTILLNLGIGIFDWIQPKYPEDLSLLYSDGLPCLTNIAHENDAWISLNQDESVRAKKTFESLFIKDN